MSPELPTPPDASAPDNTAPDHTPPDTAPMDTAADPRYPAWLLAYGNFMFRHRNLLFTVIMLALLGGFAPLTAANGFINTLLEIEGLAAVLAGISLRAVVVGMEYIKRGGLAKKVYADDLVTGGMFRHGRNPLYVGNLLIIFGILLIHGSPWTIAVGGVFFIVSYIAIVGAEETFLLGKFGDQYRAYCRDTPRWTIRLAGLSATLAGYRFNWRRVVVKEYTSNATAALMVLAVYAYQVYLSADPGRGDCLRLLLGMAVGVGVLTLVIRALKKAGWLRDTAA